MAVNYRDQYEPEQLEPFFPNEVIRWIVTVLCTLAVIMLLVTLPTILEMAGITGLVHEDEPANPRVTPEHIKPEWYFLAAYQYLKIMEYPQRWFGIDGKFLGVVTQGVFFFVLVTLPIWYRRRAGQRPRILYVVMITAVIILFLVLTVAAIWPPSPLFVGLMGVAIVVFVVLMIREQIAIRRVLQRQDADREEPS